MKKLIMEGIPDMIKRKTFVYTTLKVEGYHQFPEAAILPRYASGNVYDVSHLANKHHHYFTIKLWVEVNHLNRDIEFIQLSRWLNSVINATYGEQRPIDFVNSSCEIIGHAICDVIRRTYPHHEIRLEVSEDETNGAYLEHVPEEL